MTGSGADPKGEKTTLCLRMQHTEESIHRLSRVQFNTYCMRTKAVSLLVSVILILLGMSGRFGATTSLVLLALGCWTFMSMNAPASRNAKKMIAQAKGDLPASEFWFEEQAIVITGDGKTSRLKYRDIYSLITDGRYLYLFLNRYSAYMVPLEAKTGDALKTLLKEKTGKSLETPGNLLKWNLGMLRKKKSGA